MKKLLKVEGETRPACADLTNPTIDPTSIDAPLLFFLKYLILLINFFSKLGEDRPKGAFVAPQGALTPTAKEVAKIEVRATRAA